jgi:hypothetical protein
VRVPRTHSLRRSPRSWRTQQSPVEAYLPVADQLREPELDSRDPLRQARSRLLYCDWTGRYGKKPGSRRPIVPRNWRSDTKPVTA